MTHAEYLGDGLYAGFSGMHIWLRAERDGRTHEVALELPTVYKALIEYHDRLMKEIKNEQ